VPAWRRDERTAQAVAAGGGEVKHIDYTEIDNAICHYLNTKDGHATINDQLCQMAAEITGGKPWRLIDRRMQAMKKAGRIEFVGRKQARELGIGRHGWRVLQEVGR
jgi:hypothetical protein